MRTLLKAVALFATAALCLPISIALAGESQNNNSITLLFTHDIHDYLTPAQSYEGGELRTHGGVARLKTLIDKYSNDNSIYVDAGDFSMGTLYQMAYSTEACELRSIGACGCEVATFGNHEFDYGLDQMSSMLEAAMESGDPLPQIVCNNFDFSGDLTDEQKAFKETLAKYGVKDYAIIERGGYKIGFFGFEGYDSVECIQSDIDFLDFKEAARTTVSELEAQGCDVVIALSHAGTNEDGEGGEDFELAEEVPGIDIIVSGHGHSVHEEPVKIAGTDTYIVSCGEYLNYLGKLDFSMNNGVVEVDEYSLIPVDSSVSENADMASRMADVKEEIEDTKLSAYGFNFDDVLCESNFNFITINEMEATQQEFNIGNIIADSYIFEAKKNGYDNDAIAIVGLGTIRGSIKQGNVTLFDAFEICSLGIGGDGSVGHPLVGVYLTGDEIKLMTELDASLGSLMSSIKLSYSGLHYTFNDKRILLDKVIDVKTVKPHLPADGTEESESGEDLEGDRLYFVIANMYGLNMLGMVNDLTKGVLSITPKDANGTPIEDFYASALVDDEGNEIKEWVAFADYLSSFDENGVSEIPKYYQDSLGRKNKVEIGGFARISNPGYATNLVPAAIAAMTAIIAIICFFAVRAVRKRKRNRVA